MKKREEQERSIKILEQVEEKLKRKGLKLTEIREIVGRSSVKSFNVSI